MALTAEEQKDMTEKSDAEEPAKDQPPVTEAPADATPETPPDPQPEDEDEDDDPDYAEEYTDAMMVEAPPGTPEYVINRRLNRVEAMFTWIVGQMGNEIAAEFARTFDPSKKRF